MPGKPPSASPASSALIWFALFGLVLLFGAVLVRYPDNFFADDSYFYFQVASNFARGLGSTFNGLMPTNGYHPLWMLLCAAVFKLMLEKNTAVHGIGLLIALLNGSALIALTGLLRRAGVAIPFIVWLLYLPFCFTSQLGTEGALSGAAIAATVLTGYCLAVHLRPALGWQYGIFAALAVLSRLDNIFIVAALTIGLVFSETSKERRRMLRLLTPALLVAFILWSGYLFTNHHFFGIWQPISGLLKAHSRGEHRLFSNLPRTAWADLILIATGIVITRRYCRDRFHRVVELPFAAGILLHALYIVFALSSETRWTWYYTTWTMLASLLLARVASLPFTRARKTWRPALALCTALLLLSWYFSSYRRFGHEDAASKDPGLQQNVVERAGLRTLLAFDKPGRIAYYSTARIVPLDGLMGDLRFQQNLATKGVAAFDRANAVDGFIGPPMPLDAGGKREFCDRIFLSSVQFRCVPAGANRWTVDKVSVFARLSGTPAGTIPLPAANLVWNAPGYVAVWKLAPGTPEGE